MPDTAEAVSLSSALNRAYAAAKLLVVWWAAALARRLPSGMAVYAVSPGRAPDTQAARNAGLAVKWLFVPMARLLGMTQTPETAARRYLQASDLGTDVSGQFFASAPKKLTGPMAAMRHPHLHDRENQGPRRRACFVRTRSRPRRRWGNAAADSS